MISDVTIPADLCAVDESYESNRHLAEAKLLAVKRLRSVPQEILSAVEERLRGVLVAGNDLSAPLFGTHPYPCTLLLLSWYLINPALFTRWYNEIDGGDIFLPKDGSTVVSTNYSIPGIFKSWVQEDEPITAKA